MEVERRKRISVDKIDSNGAVFERTWSPWGSIDKLCTYTKKRGLAGERSRSKSKSTGQRMHKTLAVVLEDR
jgi:hypothetical protein